MSSRKAVHLQLSLMQAMKLVAFSAAAFACVAPIVRLWKLTGPPWSGISVVIFNAVAVPLVWVALSFVLVRRGDWRDRLVLSLLLCSVSVALAAAAWMLFMVVSDTLQLRYDSSLGLFVDSSNLVMEPQEVIRALSLVGFVTIALAGAAVFLATRLMRKFRAGARP